MAEFFKNFIETFSLLNCSNRNNDQFDEPKTYVAVFQQSHSNYSVEIYQKEFQTSTLLSMECFYFERTTLEANKNSIENDFQLTHGKF